MLLRTSGALELEGANFRRPKPLLLLAYLALEGTQTRQYLAELFFGSSKGRSSLSVTLSRLRQAAPDVIKADETKVWTSIETDAQQFLTALENADLEKGLELYQGRFLGGIDSSKLGIELEEWLYGTREFLAAQAQLAWVRLAEKEAAQGHYTEAADFAARAFKLTDANPEPDLLRRIHSLLLAGGSLYAHEVEGELEPFQFNLCPSTEDAREQLREVLGVAQSNIPNNLALRGTSFIGRDLELAEISQLLSEHQLLTLLGSGGVGKSRLALQVAQQQLSETRFMDGVYLVALDALTSADAIPPSLASVLGLNLQAEDTFAQITRYLADKHMLLLFDNFEHVIEAASFIAELLQACPFLSVLVTSRERLNVEEEWRFEVEGLAYPSGTHVGLGDARHFDGVQLFWQRARQANPNFQLSEDNLAATINICQLVEGMPLALELTATWVRVMRCDDIADALSKNLDLLTSPSRNVADKYKSIRASFEHSWQRLSEKEQTVLKNLSVFRGGFRREAAAVVTGATLPLLAALVDKSLLRMSATGRYDRHPLLYQYTQEKLAEHAEGQRQLQDHHAYYFLDFAEDSAPRLNGSEQGHWLQQLQNEHDNIETALKRLIQKENTEASLRLAIAASQYWSKSGYFQDGYTFLIKVLGFTKADKALSAKAYTRAGSIKFQQREMEEAWTLFEKGLKLSRELDDKRGLSAGLNNLGNLAASWGDLKRARPLLEESLALRREIDLKGAMAWSLLHLSGVELAEGYVEKAREMLEEALEILRLEGDKSSQTWVLGNFGWLELKLGNYEAAEAYFEQSLEFRREINDIASLGTSYFNLGHLARIQDKDDVAKQHFFECLKWSRELEVKPDTAAALFQLGELALEQNKMSEAHVYLGECLSLRRETNDVNGIAEIFETFVRFAIQHQAYQRAAILWGALEKITVQTQVEQLEVIKQNLPEDMFLKAWQEGQKMRLEQVMTLMFDEVVSVMNAI